MKLFTIGVNEKSAEEFFSLLKKAGVQKVLDIRLNNKSQLQGFSKGRDLKYFCEQCHGIKYEHVPMLAPSKELLKSFRANRDWRAYERAFGKILRSRPAREIFDKAAGGLESVCLLCTEVSPKQCHRRLAAEYLSKKLGGVEIVHL